MQFIYELGKGRYGYHTELEKAVLIASAHCCEIDKLYLDRENDFREPFLELRRYNQMSYYVYASNKELFNPGEDVPKLAREKRAVEEERQQMECARAATYRKTPEFGWCDYPQQFVEKCPFFSGTVKFEKIERNKCPGYLVRTWKERSSKHVDGYYIGVYIGNHPLQETQFHKFDGITTDPRGIPYPKVDELWKFETDGYPFQDFVLYDDIKLRIDSGNLQTALADS